MQILDHHFSASAGCGTASYEQRELALESLVELGSLKWMAGGLPTGGFGSKSDLQRGTNYPPPSPHGQYPYFNRHRLYLWFWIFFGG